MRTHTLSKSACPGIAAAVYASLVFIGMVMGALFAGSADARAQALAGPNRPPQVPDGYVVTPFGYFHPSCVVHLVEGEELLEGGQVIQRADGTSYTVPVCGYPRYTARGQMIASGSPVKPPEIAHSWVVTGETVGGSSYGEIAANWNVPNSPTSYDRQTIYLFPGLMDIGKGDSIIQPVLGWDADFRRAWGIASWNCCPSDTVDESPAVRVSTGDQIQGTVKSMCSPGTLSCPQWQITTKDATTGQSTTLNNSPSEQQTFNWAFGATLEVYDVVQCSDYPPEGYLTFYPTLYDNNFNKINGVDWSLYDLTQGLDPQCGYGGTTGSDHITLGFANFNLNVSINGSGSVTNPDGSIQCPGTCSQSYNAAGK